MFPSEIKVMELQQQWTGETTLAQLQTISNSNQQMIIAQYVRDPNVLGQMQSAWKNFVKSGQIWALLIGLFVGYTFRSMTSS